MILNKSPIWVYNLIIITSVIIGMIYIYLSLKKDKCEYKKIYLFFIMYVVFAFVFGKAFAIGAGLISGLISALFLTDIGMYVWKIVPLSWTARIPETFLAYELADRGALSEIKSHAPIYLVVVAVCFAGYFAFATNYEGSKISE